MAITIAYRGEFKELDRIEDFEDRVLDLALEVGGAARIWRSGSRDDSRRLVRGVELDLVPGQETLSLLVSPEGWLISLYQVGPSEQGELPEAPWCSVDTHYGPVEGHAAVVEVLDALRKEFFSSLEVQDDSGYWETRDISRLLECFAQAQADVDQLCDAPDRWPLAAETQAAGTISGRISQITRQIHQTLTRPSEHPPILFDDEDASEVDEAKWDALYREHRRKQERILRSMAEQMQRGAKVADALEKAMQYEGIIGLPGEAGLPEPADEWEDEEGDVEEEEAWRESLPEAVRTDSFERFADRGQHPLLRQSHDLLARLDRLLGSLPDNRTSHLEILYRGAADMMGGLAQTLGTREAGPGLCLV